MAVEHLTPQQVLDILRECHRQQCANGDADTTLSFDMDSTLAEFHDAMAADFWAWKDVGVFLDWLFDTRVANDTWKSLLVPKRARRLGPLCEHIASQAVTPVIEPVTILGSRCKAAGIFVTLRDRLETRGLDVSELAPSSPLEPVLIHHVQELSPELFKIGAGRIPEIKIRTPLHDWCESGFMLCLVAGLVALRLGGSDSIEYPWAGIVLAGSTFGGALLWASLFITSRMRPSRVEFGGLYDFRDLCRLLAAPKVEQPRTP